MLTTVATVKVSAFIYFIPVSIIVMDSIKKKLTNLKLQVEEAEMRALEAEKEKKELKTQAEEASIIDNILQYIIVLFPSYSCKAKLTL